MSFQIHAHAASRRKASTFSLWYTVELKSHKRRFVEGYFFSWCPLPVPTFLFGFWDHIYPNRSSIIISFTSSPYFIEFGGHLKKISKNKLTWKSIPILRCCSVQDFRWAGDHQTLHLHSQLHVNHLSMSACIQRLFSIVTSKPSWVIPESYGLSR